MMRYVMYWGHTPSLPVWLAGAAVAILTTALGFAWFQKTRKGFADVL